MTSTATARRRFSARPRPEALLDVALAVVMLAGSLVLLSHVVPAGIIPTHPGSREHTGELILFGVVLAACSTVPLAAWRRFPHGVFVVTVAASVLLAGLGYPIHLLLGPTAAVYLLASSRTSRGQLTQRATVAAVGLLATYLGAITIARGTAPSIDPYLLTGLAWAVAWLAGERTRLRREQIAELKQRALRAEREAERERRLAAAEERARIARDLHDSAGHAISVIAVRAGAARMRHRQDPDRSLKALEAIEELARQTGEELDQIVGRFRERSGANVAIDAPPGLASLDTLIADHQAAGLAVTLHTSGASRPLGSSVDQAVYRILQEALTNAARHGTGSALIDLTFAEAGVELSVTNPVPVRSSPRLSGGHGVIGMHERATLLGGSLDAERAGRTFRVSARIPYERQRT